MYLGSHEIEMVYYKFSTEIENAYGYFKRIIRGNINELYLSGKINTGKILGQYSSITSIMPK